MMHAHRIVGCDGAIEKGPARAVLVLFAQLVEGTDTVPESEDCAFLSGKIDLSFDLVKRHGASPLQYGSERVILQRTQERGEGYRLVSLTRWQVSSVPCFNSLHI